MQVAIFCVNFALLELFVSESLYMNKNISGVRNLSGAAQQNQVGNAEVWEKGGWGEGKL